NFIFAFVWLNFCLFLFGLLRMFLNVCFSLVYFYFVLFTFFFFFLVIDTAVYDLASGTIPEYSLSDQIKSHNPGSFSFPNYSLPVLIVALRTLQILSLGRGLCRLNCLNGFTFCFLICRFSNF